MGVTIDREGDIAWRSRGENGGQITPDLCTVLGVWILSQRLWEGDPKIAVSKGVK